jgi:transcriptional regulator with XRE-family HTH domain
VVIVSNGPGNIIKNIRINKSLSQFNLALKAGISQSFLSNIESGQKSPTMRIIYKLSNALDISPELLVTGNLYNKKLANDLLLKQRKLEEKINITTGQVYKAIIGHGPMLIKTRIIEDIIIIRCNNYSDSMIDYLLKTDNGKKVYIDLIDVLFNTCKNNLANNIEEIIENEVKQIYYTKKIKDNEIIITVICSNNILK